MSKLHRVYRVSLFLILLLIIPASAFAQLSINSQWWSTSNTPIVNDDGGYYVIYDGYMYYFDKESLQPILLCSRLDCLHKGENNPADCDAFCDDTISIGLFEDHLYFVMNAFTNGIYTDAIYQAEKDGSKHRVYINLGDFSNILYEDCGFINGYYFYITEKVLLPKENLKVDSFEMIDTLYMVDLRKPNDPPVLIDTWNNLDKAVLLRQVVDNTLYFIMGSFEGEKSIWGYNLLSHDKQKIMDYTGMYGFFMKDNLMYLLSSEDGIEVYDSQTKNKKTIFSFSNDSDKGIISSDGKYFYVFQKTNTDGNDSKEALIINYNGSIVNRIKLPEEMLLFYPTEDYLFLRSMDSFAFPNYAIRMSDFESHDIQLISINHP